MKDDYWLFLLYMLLLLIFRMDSSTASRQANEVATVWVEEGGKAELPCDLSVPDGDKVNMVLWYKDDTGIPIYSVDGRQSNLLNGAHLTMSDVGARCYFSISQIAEHDSYLKIIKVTQKDAGLYKCRVDYLNSPTKIFRVNLSLITLPSPPILLDEQGREITGDTIGPYKEGAYFQLRCLTHGGKPKARISWLLNGDVLTTSTQVASGDKVESTLLIHSIPRNYNGQTLQCQVNLADTVTFLDKSVRLNIYVKPTSVAILHGYSSLQAGKSEQIVCESSGSNPPAEIHWFLDGEHIRQAAINNQNPDAHTKRSMLFIRPEPSDNDKVLTCRSENPHFRDFSLEDRKRLKVFYAPLPNISLMSKTNFNNIKEGDSLLIKCIADANPPAEDFTWYHNDVIIKKSNSDAELNLEAVTKDLSGNYECEASNRVGSKRSRPVTVNILHAPVCNEPTPQTILAMKNEMVILRCEVDSESEDSELKFFWTFNDNRTILPVQSMNYQTSGRTSILKFTPSNDLEYGNFECSAQNSVGRQKSPCLFFILPAKRPDRPQNCSIEGKVKRAQIVCSAGFDGGQKQYFILEVRETSSLNLTVEEDFRHYRRREYSAEQLNDQPFTPIQETDPALFSFKGEKPVFNLDRLPPLKTYALTLYAVNMKGRSDPVIILHTATDTGPDGNISQTSASSSQENGSGSVINQSISVPLSYVMIITVSLVLILLLILLLSISLICRRSQNRRQEAIERDVNNIRLMFSNEDKADSTHVNFETEF